MKKPRIGFDLDDVLAEFMGAYMTYFEVDKNPRMMEDAIITRNVQNILRHDRDFWVNLPVKNHITFVPELYCTKRVNNKTWTKAWLKANDFPVRPVYQMFYQQGNKADMIKGKVDLFIDDSLSNVMKMNASGVPTLLFHTDRTADCHYCKIYSLDEEEILDAYRFMKFAMTL